MTNIRALPGVTVPSSSPNPGLIEALEGLLEQAQSGELQHFAGTGFHASGNRITVIATANENVYAMRGAIAWLGAEYERLVDEDNE